MTNDEQVLFDTDRALAAAYATYDQGTAADKAALQPKIDALRQAWASTRWRMDFQGSEATDEQVAQVHQLRAAIEAGASQQQGLAALVQMAGLLATNFAA